MSCLGECPLDTALDGPLGCCGRVLLSVWGGEVFDRGTQESLSLLYVPVCSMGSAVARPQNIPGAC